MLAGRAIVTRTAGRQHGPVKRLVSPSDLGDVLKPFVFLDYFDSSVEAEHALLHASAFGSRHDDRAAGR
jgi:hypothetical protein